MSYVLAQELPEYQQDIERLMQSDQNFSELLHQYHDLDQQIKLLVLSSDTPELSLSGLAKQRLSLKTALLQQLIDQ